MQLPTVLNVAKNDRKCTGSLEREEPSQESSVPSEKCGSDVQVVVPMQGTAQRGRLFIEFHYKWVILKR
jgi:hypothetical protein